jgi:hypothetical protein
MFSDNGFEISQIIIGLAGVMLMEDEDKSDIINCLLSLLKRLLSQFLTTVLKAKSNLNLNDY